MSAEMQVVVWCSVLLGIMLLAALVWIFVIRPRLFGMQETGPVEPLFDLGRLEAMRRSGELSDEEFRRLRKAALGLAAPGVASTGQPAESNSRPSPEAADAQGDSPEGDDSPQESE